MIAIGSIQQETAVTETRSDILSGEKLSIPLSPSLTTFFFISKDHGCSAANKSLCRGVSQCTVGFISNKRNIL